MREAAAYGMAPGLAVVCAVPHAKSAFELVEGTFRADGYTANIPGESPA